VTTTTAEQAAQCEMTSAHRSPAPAVTRMQGGTVLCADCAVLMARDAVNMRRTIQLTPIDQPAVTS
jgi:hypothetical protein